jgi:5-methylcytosine-specific restriction endonuclease McrA
MKPDLSLDTLLFHLIKAIKATDKAIVPLSMEKQRIESYYSPRAKFERWRDSVDGKTWKETQYKKQNGCCDACKCIIELKGSHIDHRKPISKFPELTLDPNNLRICCPTCNTSKQDKVD